MAPVTDGRIQRPPYPLISEIGTRASTRSAIHHPHSSLTLAEIVHPGRNRELVAATTLAGRHRVSVSPSMGAGAAGRRSGRLRTDCRGPRRRRSAQPRWEPTANGIAWGHGRRRDKRPLVPCRAGGQASLQLDVAGPAREKFR